MNQAHENQLTPVQRLQASRIHMRAFLLQAQSHPESVLQTILKPLAAEIPWD